jgi:hypothetical protein
MNSGKQIIQYLEELASALVDLRVSLPFHILVAGGAYMLLQKKRRFTLDIDFALIEEPQARVAPDSVFRTVLRRAEVSGKSSTIPYSAEFKQAVALVAQRHRGLSDDWLNDEAAVYFYDDAPRVEVTFWRSFKNVVYIYLPTMEYVFATKIAAYRLKDREDIQLLIRALKIHKRQQAQGIVEKFLLPEAISFWEVDEKLDELFP